jgi:hypothetical protein
MIAEDAGDPNASLMPIRTTIAARMYIEMFSGLKKTTTLPMIALKPSETIRIVFRGRRSTHTPPIGAINTPESTRAPRINPSVVALPPASRTVTAKAIGNADIATIVRIAEIIKFRYPAKERRAPGSKYFFNIFEPNAPL